MTAVDDPYTVAFQTTLAYTAASNTHMYISDYMQYYIMPRAYMAPPFPSIKRFHVTFPISNSHNALLSIPFPGDPFFDIHFPNTFTNAQQLHPVHRAL